MGIGTLLYLYVLTLAYGNYRPRVLRCVALGDIDLLTEKHAEMAEILNLSSKVNWDRKQVQIVR